MRTSITTLKLASVLAVAVATGALYAAVPTTGPGSPTNEVSCCLNGSAMAQRLQPTFTGDMKFFASQSNDAPNVVVMLDNSGSMIEFQLPVDDYKNTRFVTSSADGLTKGALDGRTPNGPNNDATLCHSNPYLEARKYLGTGAGAGLKYDKTITYPVWDPGGNGGTTGASFTNFFETSKYYKYMEWTSSNPGGDTDALNACNSMSNTAGSGGGSLLTAQTQRQRCKQCLDEAGYYIKPNSGGATDTSGDDGKVVFKGNFVNFFPPKFVVGRRLLTDFIQAQVNTRLRIAGYNGSNGAAFIGTGTNMVPGCGCSIAANDCTEVNWTQAQKDAMIKDVRGISFSNSTPLAEALFDIGQYLAGDSASTFWNAKFSGFVDGKFTSLPTTDSGRTLCTACQVSAAVLITDGIPNSDNTLPNFPGISNLAGNTPVVCSTTGQVTCNDGKSDLGCGCDQNNDATRNRLADVASILANNDLNTGGSFPGTQMVHTYVIGLGVDIPLLQAAANAGKGVYYRANDSTQLTAALSAAVLDINNRATAFSSTAIQTLEVGTGSSAYVPRFTPQPGAIWDGHLLRFDLFNEFVANIDKNSDGKLDGVFLVDKDSDIIVESDKGEFLKAKNNQKAVPIWDAGELLQARANSARTIYTAIPTVDGTGKITGWTRTAFADDDTSATALLPYLGFQGTNACTVIASKMAGNPTLSALDCAKAIIKYVRGYDLFGQNPTDTTNHNRPYVLGDIFHSSPVVVDPPVDQFICSLGLHAQCVSTLYGYQSPSALAAATPTANYTVASKTVDAYEKYLTDNNGRRKIALVGANDGMIHAFDAGSPTATPPVQDPGSPFRSMQYTKGTGAELWAFIPPDQLPRLYLMLTIGHQFSMDGDIMVRDIWVDGSGSGANQAGVKQSDEYHTVAVVGEREGGTHSIALDLTDTTSPQMRWMWPPPCSVEEQQWGQTWGQFTPRAPPIGPLLLETAATGGIQRYGVSTEERWAVFLNGGRDPYRTRGRAIAMLDVWTGAPLFKASYNPSATDASKEMRYAFPATAALVDYSKSGTFANDGFFDTAVIGDEGGQVWTFRFGTPGHLTSGLADNWTFGRAYEPVADGNPKTAALRNGIYSVASTTVQEETGWLRTYLGTGDRTFMRSTGGGDCQPDNLVPCVEAGCTVSSALTTNIGPNRYTSTFAGTSGNLTTPTQASTTTSSFACQTADASLNVTASGCSSPIASFTLSYPSAAASCSGSSSYACTTGGLIPSPPPSANRGAAANGAGSSRFLSIAVVASAVGSPSRARTLNVPADAAAYDTNRLQLSELVDITNLSATTGSVTGGTPANRTSAGWHYSYTTVDEKTATSSTLLGGCVLWSSLIPSSTAGGCASAGAVTSPLYQADFITGAPTCAESFRSGVGWVRSVNRSVIAPPPEVTPVVEAGGNKTRLSLMSIQPDADGTGSGSGSVERRSVTTNNEMLQLLYSVPLTADEHQCRHVSAASCP